MAYLKWTTGRYMFVVILVDMWAHAANGLLIVKPQDTYVLAGHVASLNCSTSSSEDVHWYYGTSYVYAGRKLYSPYKDRLKIEVYQIDDITAYNLVFPSATPEDAGKYNCLDDQGRGETSSAEVTVFTADGNGTCQSNMKPDGVIIPNDCNIDPDKVHLSCSVTFYGSHPPQLEWKKVPENGASVANTECQRINNRIICNASIIGDRSMNGSTYVCQITGSSQLIIRLCTIEVKNLIYAFSGETTKKSSVGNEVQCNSDTSQTCRYKWKHSGSVVSTSRTITPDTTGLYQCEAECNFRGKRCIIFDYAYITDDDSLSCATGCVVAICLGILVFIFIVAVILYFLLRKDKAFPKNEWKLKKKTRNVRGDQNEPPKDEASLIQKTPKTKKNAPNLIRTLKPKAEHMENKAIFGLTILGDELFVLVNGWHKIEVFGDLKELKSKREFFVTDHKLEIPWDIQSSSNHECLYIVDKKRNEEEHAEIIQIDPQGIVKKRWRTECIAGRLSVTNESNVIFTSLYQSKMCEYSPDGDLIREIELPSNVGIVSPWLTLKRSEDEYVVSHGNRGDSRHGVCVIDQKGNIKQYFGGRNGSNYDQLYVPVHMVAYSDGRILVADKDNKRVILLSLKLKLLKAFFSQGDELRFPSRICLDESNNRLIVADNLWISDVKPFANGRVLVFQM